MKQTNFDQTPWEHQRGNDRRMSAIVSASGKLIAGSMVCRQPDDETVKAHAMIVRAVNEHAALVAVAAALVEMVSARERVERDNAKVEDPYGTCYTASQISGMWGSAMVKSREALAALAAIRQQG